MGQYNLGFYGKLHNQPKKCYQNFQLENIFGTVDNFLKIYYEVNDSLWAKYRNQEITKEYLTQNRFNNSFIKADFNNMPLSLKVNDAYLYYTSQEYQLVDGALQLLEYLKTHNYNLSIVTNGFAEVQHRKFENSGIKHYFDYQIISDNAQALKPSKDFFDYTFKTTNYNPDETLLVGDDPEADIAGAVSYGLKAVYLDRFGKPCRYQTEFNIKSLIELINYL